MHKQISVLARASALTAAFVLAGCASTPSSTASGTPSGTPSGTTTGSAPASSPSVPAPAAAPAAESRTAPAVTVPAASARKLVLAMTGPKIVVDSKDWADFKREWRETFAEYAKGAGIAFSFAEGEAKPTGEEGTLLLVTVADYRIVGIGARIFFGVMTGNAFIDAKVRFANLRDGAVFGEQPYITSSSAWGGVFAKVTPQQVDAIARNVFVDLKAAK